MLCKDNIYQSHCEMKMKFCWFSPPHCYICAIRTKLVSGQKGKKKEILFPFCSTSAAYMFSSGRLLMASCFSLSMARVYFSMCFNPLCPRMLATVLMLLPLLRRFTAQEWRAQCQLICLSMPARFTHRFTDLQQLS